MSLHIPPDALPLDLDALAWLAPPDTDTDNPDIVSVYDGVPMLYVARSYAGALFLAYCCDQDQDGATYLLAPTSREVVDALLSNRLPVRDAVLTPWAALVFYPWVSWDVGAVWGYVIRPEDVPDDHLPVPGVTMYLPQA